MCEVQKHGKLWELDMLRNVYGITDDEMKELRYTDKMDLPGKFNHLDPGVNMSVKTTGKENLVCMGDCLRVYDAVKRGEPFHMVVLVYTQNDDTKTKKVKTIAEIDLTNAVTPLFGDITRAQVEQLDKAVKAVPQKRKPTQEEHDHMYTLRNELQTSSVAIHFDIKCNSTQSRLQCSLNRFQDFLNQNPDRIIAKRDTTTGLFRGKKIVEEIASSRRVFTKKEPNP
jgi:hypothetical protein